MKVYKPKRFEMLTLIWGLLWTIPLFLSMGLLMLIARVGFGKSVANTAAREWLK